MTEVDQSAAAPADRDAGYDSAAGVVSAGRGSDPVGGGRGGKGKGGRRKRDEGPRSYDFRRPTKLSREHVRALQLCFETFARQWSTIITTTLRVMGNVSLVSVEQLSYEEYVNSMARQTFMGMLTIDPLPGLAVVDIPLDSAMTTIDHMLGGAGAPGQPDRPLTDIEAALYTRFLNRVLDELTYAFGNLAPLRASISKIEYQPQFAQAAQPSEMFVVATFEMRYGESDGLATFGIPFNGIFPVLESALGKQAMSARERAQRELAARLMAQRLVEVPVNVAIRFEPTTLTTGEILSLTPGQVVPLGHRIGVPLRVDVDGLTVVHAVAGRQGRRLACLVVPPPEE